MGLQLSRASRQSGASHAQIPKSSLSRGGCGLSLPHPFLAVANPKRGRARERWVKARAARCLVNLWILFLNLLHGGQEKLRCEWAPSAAQQRVHKSLLGRARDFLRRSPDVAPSGEDVRNHARMNLSAYMQHPAAMPLGVSAGIPEQAATCYVVRTFKAF